MRFFFKSLCHGNFWYGRSAFQRKSFPIVNFWRPHLVTLDIHVVDHCNLNCKGCAAFSPLAKEWFYDVVQLERDLLELSKKIRFFQLKLIGGETLLHPKITEIVQITRRIFSKKSVLSIVTNGSLLPQMSGVFWKVCRENRVFLALSVYPPFQKHLDTYCKLAKANGINVLRQYNWQHWDSLQCSFGNQRGAEIFYRSCNQNTCHKLWNSKLYICPMCFLQHYNHYFNENHETVKGYDIYKYSGKELVQFMKRPDPACRYCTWVVKNETTQWDYSKREKSEWCEDV